MSAPLRALGAVMLVWCGARAAMLLPGAQEAMAPAPAPVRALLGMAAAPAPAPVAAAPPVAARIAAVGAPSSLRTPDDRTIAMADLLTADAPGIAPAPRAAGPMRAEDRVLLAAYLAPVRRADLAMPLAAPVARPVGAAAMAAGRRWSGDAYLFARGGAGGGLAPGAQLGGGQAFVRVSRALGGGLAATGRLSSALDGQGAEAAGGIAWRPSTAVPAGITLERRAALDDGGRHAWAAFAAGGADAVRLGRGMRLDAYAQAGLVGARRADAFVDGAARIGRVVGPLSLGAGAWGAAQPGASRLDIGPQAAFRLSLGDVAATAALDWRFRVAGAARPGGGIALTLAAGF